MSSPDSRIAWKPPWGPIEGKVAWPTDRTARFSPEFESCRKAAAEHGVALRAVYEAARKAFDPEVVEGKRKAESGKR